MVYENFERGNLRRRHYEEFKKLSEDKIHILLACFPKSGSSYLRELIHNLPDMEQVNLLPGYDRREQELATDELILNHSKNYVAQHHTRYSQITEILMDNFRLQPVILVRNLFDVVESIHDHFFREGIIMPFNFVPDEILKWEKSEIVNFITDMIIPWYFNFYVSWYHRNNKLLVTYDDVTQNTGDVLQKIIDFTHISCSKKDIDNSIECSSKLNTRLNKGVSGRGEKLSDDVKNKIISMSKYYKKIDFSPIGL